MMLWLWIAFVAFVVAMLALDLGVIHRKAHVVSLKESLGWSAVWIGISLAFAPVVYLLHGSHLAGFGTYDPDLVARNPSLYPDSALEAMTMYLAGYVTEKSLSVDNIFVIAIIFAYFRIPALYQHRVLFWGILGAIVLRGIFIGLGTALIASFHWIIYVFGVILLVTSIKLLFAGEEMDPSRSRIVRFIYRYFPVTDTLHGERFLIRREELAPSERVDEAWDEAAEGGKPAQPARMADKSALVLTPLGLVLLVVEGTDVIFAVDSIPAIFGITADPFLVFTSNIFAILGLRALYFALAGVIRKFHHLQTALALILGYISIKMLASGLIHKVEWLHEAMPYVTLAVVILGIAGGIVASLIFPGGEPEPEQTEPPPLETPRTSP